MSMMTMKLYETLSIKFGADAAESFAQFVEEKIKNMEPNLDIKISTVESLIKTEIANAKADVLKWVLTLFVTQIAFLLSALALLKR